MNAHEQEHMWSTRYRSAGEDYVFGTTPNRFLAAQAALLASGADALSVADGEGRNAVWLAEQGLAVTATEISPVALERARKLAAGRHVEVAFVLADALADLTKRRTADLKLWRDGIPEGDVCVGSYPVR